MKGYELAAEELREAGLATIFGLMGDANLDLLACAIERHGVRYFATRHESGAIAMADGYARATGQIGVASVTSGPGFTNSLTALTTAVRNGSKLLLVTGQIPLNQFSRNQRIDQCALAELTGAQVVQVETPNQIPGSVARALALIEETGRPVVLNLFTPALYGAVERAGADDRAPGPQQVNQARPTSPPETFSEFATSLNRAQRPVILVGRGALATETLSRLATVADRIGAAIVTTLCAKGALADHPHHMGLAGGFSDPDTIAVLQQADVVAAFGASLNAWTTRAGTIFGDGKILQCDDEPDAFGRSTISPAVRLLADAGDAAQELLGALEDKARKTEKGWWQAAEESAASVPGTDSPSSERVDPRALCLELDRILPSNRIVAVDGGHFFEFPSRYLNVPDHRGFLYTLSFGSIGLALPMGLGAAVGRPDRRVAIFVGDGGLLMSLPELETLVRHRLPATIVVMNDAAYGAEVKHLEERGWSRALAEFETPDLAAVARALGATSCRISSIEELW